MRVSYTVNNYQLRAKVKSTPTHKIISKNRNDKMHTEVVYDGFSVKEKEFCDKVLAQYGKIIFVGGK